MPILNQNIIKFEDDTFDLFFAVTSNSTALINAQDPAWWGCSETYGGTSILEKSSPNWIDISPPSGDIIVVQDIPVSYNIYVTVKFSQADFAASGGPLVTNTTYYWELIVAKTAYEDSSQVTATGTLRIDPSQFSTKGYRP